MASGGNLDRISQSLFDACVDLQPHQIEAGLFALKSPLSKGVILADEVGLGKTIEAGLILCQFWAERKRKLLVVAPASIRKQWQLELTQKFNLPSIVLDSREYELLRKQGYANPFAQERIIVISYQYASRNKDIIGAIPWDLVVLDEAHRLRNANTQVSQNLRASLGSLRKLMLTATPLQNTITELFTLTSFIDDHTFGDKESFRTQYSTNEDNFADLRHRLKPVVKRTLRKDVLEYIRFTKRHPITVTFDPEAPENQLYENVSAFLQREGTYALPALQRHLMVLVLRKILASSSTALAATLQKIQYRLKRMLDGQKKELEGIEELLDDEIIDEDEAEEIEEDIDAGSEEGLDLEKLRTEITELEEYIKLARSIKVDTKSKALLKGLTEGFNKMKEIDGPRKALVFTESRRTQEYLRIYLEANGYKDQIVLFNGTNSEPESKAIYDEWRRINEPLGRATGNRNIDQRTALIEYFRDHATIMLATEAAGEGVNLQFCSLVINYDLPWNPQRIEQRIGRCHRYGQKHDVVVVNFLNSKNEADKRVLELLSEKFHLFKGVFGSSDEVLGALESGVDFERKVLCIYQKCRTPHEIDSAFTQLQKEMEQEIKSRMEKVRQALLEHFDEEVHSRFRNFMTDTQNHLGRIEDMFWRTTKQVLGGNAKFMDKKREFQLLNPPSKGISTGTYRLISRSASGHLQEESDNNILYRISHPLGEYVLEQAKSGNTPVASLVFQITGHTARIMVLEDLKDQSGWLTLTKLWIKSFGEEEHHIFTTFTDGGQPIHSETTEKMFQLAGTVQPINAIPPEIQTRLSSDTDIAVQAQLDKTLRINEEQFKEEEERLERWADDRTISSENLVKELDLQIKNARRQARQATTLNDRLKYKEEEKQLMLRRKRAREDVFNAADEIHNQMESFIDDLQKQLQQATKVETLFTIRWSVK